MNRILWWPQSTQRKACDDPAYRGYAPTHATVRTMLRYSLRSERHVLQLYIFEEQLIKFFSRHRPSC